MVFEYLCSYKFFIVLSDFSLQNFKPCLVFFIENFFIVPYIIHILYLQYVKWLLQFHGLHWTLFLRSSHLSFIGPFVFMISKSLSIMLGASWYLLRSSLFLQTFLAPSFSLYILVFLFILHLLSNYRTDK